MSTLNVVDNTQRMEEILNNVSIVHVLVNVWSARAKIGKEELPSTVTDMLPPEGLATLGTKRLFNPDKIRPFNSIRSKVSAYLDLYGVRVLGGWAIPNSTIDVVMNELADINNMFDDLLADFENSYEEGVREWAETFPEYQTLLYNSVPSIEQVRDKFKFSVSKFKVSPQFEDNSGDFVNDVTNLDKTLLERTAVDLQEAYKQSLSKTKVFSERSFNCVDKIVDKLDSFAFTNPDAYLLAQLLRKEINTVRDNVQDDAYTSKFVTMVGMCVNADALGVLLNSNKDDSNSLMLTNDLVLPAELQVVEVPKAKSAQDMPTLAHTPTQDILTPVPAQDMPTLAHTPTQDMPILAHTPAQDMPILAHTPAQDMPTPVAMPTPTPVDAMGLLQNLVDIPNTQANNNIIDTDALLKGIL